MMTASWMFVLLGAAAPMIGAAQREPPAELRLGTATPGGGFELYGQALAKAIHAADPSLDVVPVATKGSTENVPMLEGRRLDLGLATGEVAHEALARPPPGNRVRVLSAMYPSPGMFAVRADSPYRRIEDLRGRPVVFGARGSGLVVLARYVLDGLGLDMDRDFQPILLDRAQDGPHKVLSGEAAALWGGGSAWPGFTAVASAASGARFLVPDLDGVRRITAKYPFIRPMTVSARSYPGQREPIASVGTWAVVLVRADLPDPLVYRLARALHHAEAAIAARVPQGSATTTANTAVAVQRHELHPAVLRYLREIGALEP